MNSDQFQKLAWATSERARTWAGPMAAFQELRRRLKGNTRARDLFHEANVKTDYAYHAGGQNEFQLNMGIEPNGVLRVGLAFSLETSTWVWNVAEQLGPKIDRFNAFISDDPVLLQEVDVAYWQETNNPQRHYIERGHLPPELVKARMFIFMGRLFRDAAASPDSILAYWDGLLPLYEKVEGRGEPPSKETLGTPAFKPGGPPRTNAGPILMRPGTGVITKNDEHDRIQRALYNDLLGQWGAQAVKWEHPLPGGTQVDIAVSGSEGLTFFEVKSGDDLRDCFREAIGQLLEYAHWGGEPRCHRMVVVTKLPLTDVASTYLEFLRDRYGLPLEYMQVESAPPTSS